MGELGRLDDPRCADALDLLESKRLPDGGFPLEERIGTTRPVVASRGTFADWGPSGTTRSNPLVTVAALGVLRRAGGSGGAATGRTVAIRQGAAIARAAPANDRLDDVGLGVRVVLGTSSRGRPAPASSVRTAPVVVVAPQPIAERQHAPDLGDPSVKTWTLTTVSGPLNSRCSNQSGSRIRSTYPAASIGGT